MEEDLYERLRQHFNEGPTTKLRKTKELMEILEILFTPEQVAFAMALPLTVQGRVSLEELALRLGRNAQDVGQVVETMAREGKVLATTSRKDGRTYYSLWPLLPGILESTFADGIDSDQRRRLARLLERYYSEGLWNELASSNYPQFRIIPINKNVDPSSQVLPFEVVGRLIEEAQVITVIPCLCRAVSRRCDHILEADFVFGAWAEYLIRYRGARRWTKDEALRRLEECEEDGLMHLTGNAQEGSAVICNCCSCCCKAIRGLTELHNPRSFVRSNFEPRVRQDKCTMCLKCQKVCPMRAIARLPGYRGDGSDTRMIVQESRCVGCGLCATHCPAGAVAMVKVRDHVPAKTLAEMTQRYLEEKLW